MEETPVKLSKREGTSDSGRLYELKVTALLALRCVENPKVKHAWFASNVNHAYDFDDVILYVKDESDHCTAYLMQLKHQEYPKNIPRKDFLYDAKTKKKSNMSEDFSLFKYQKSYLQIKESLEGSVGEDERDGLVASLKDADEIFYVLYTNRPVGAKYDFLNVSGDERSLLDTSDGGCNVHGFNTEAFELPGDFLRHLLLFTQQEHVTRIDELIKKELKRVMHAVSIDRGLKKYLDFVEMRISGDKNSTLVALTKNDLAAQLTSFALEDYLVKFSLNASSPSEFLLWSELVDGKPLVVVEETESTSEFLTSYVAAKIAEHCNLDNWNQELSKESFYKKFPDLKPALTKAIGEGTLTPFGIYQALWLQKKVPMLVQARTSKDFKRIQAALFLSRDQNYPVAVLTSVIIPATSNCFFDLNHLDQKHQNLILEHPITLQGRPGARLGDVVNKSMYKMIKCKDIIDIISNRYRIGDAQGAVLQFYVPRAVSKVLFRQQALTEVSSKFVLRGIDPTNFKPGKSTVIFENDLTPSNDLKDYHDFRLVDGDFFELVRNYASTKCLREHQVVQVQTLDAPDCCWLHPHELEKLLDQSPCVINANPGMGKTELLNHFSLNAPLSLWILKVNLNEHNDYFKNLKHAGKTALDHLKYFYGSPSSSNQELTEKVFLRFVKQKKVLVLLDGFDEISMTYKKEATSIATSLHESDYKMWVSTRPVTKAHLEDALNTVSRTLKPLVVEDQKHFLTQYFGHMASSEAQKRTIAEFVEKLLEAAAANLNDSDNRFTGLPLQTKLLADVFKKDLEEILRTGKFLFSDKFDLIFLYDSFLKEKTNIFCRKFGDIYRDMHMFFEKLQQLFALQIVFSAHLLKKLRVEQKLKEFYEDDDRMVHFLQREGVVVIYQRDTNSEEKFDVNFVHRTFAEFLAAKWLYRAYKTEDVCDLIKCRFKVENEFLFSVFDRYVSKNLPLHLSIINRNKREALELIRSDPKSIGRVDGGGRTVLHLLSCYALDHSSYYTSAVVDEMVEVFDALSENVVTNAEDDILGYNALEYAISSNTLAIADKLCQQLKVIEFSLYIHEKYLFFFHCDLNQYRHLFLLVLKYFARMGLLERTVKPFVLFDDYCYSLANLIKYASTYKSITVLDLVRSTCTDDDIGFVAAFGGKDELLQLLEEGVKVDTTDSNMCTALHYASIHNRLENAKLLISKCATGKRRRSSSVAYVNSQNHEGKSALHLAIQNLNFSVAHALIDQGADVNLPDAWDTTPFLYMCEYGQLDLVIKTLPLVTDINLRNLYGKSALHVVVLNRDFNIARVLIDDGADVNLPDASGTSAFCYACKFGETDVIKKMLPLVTDINFQGAYDESALVLALQSENFDVARVLIDEGADVNLNDGWGTTPFFYACQFAKSDLVKKMVPAVTDLNFQSKDGECALHLVLRNRDFDMAHVLVDGGASVNLADASGTTSFLHACKLGQVDLVQKMLPMVVDLNLQNEDNENALHLAIRNQSFDVAHVLIDEGAEVNSVAASGMTPFLYACEHGTVGFIKKMLPKVTDLDFQNKDGDSALHLALKAQNFDTAHLLVDQGADVNITDVWGTTAFLYSCKYAQVDLIQKILPLVTDMSLQNRYGDSALHLVLSNQDLAQALIDKGADVNLPDASGMTPFLCACKLGRVALFKSMLSTVKDINFQNKYNENALHIAIQNGNLDVAHDLIAEGAEVNSPDVSRTTAFLYACEHGKVDLVNKILPLVKNINLKPRSGKSALHLALAAGNFDVAHALVDGGADVNLTNPLGVSAFACACKFADVDLVKKMISVAAKINLQNYKGESALHLAILNRSLDVAHALIDEGADVNLPDASGTTAFLYACEYGKTDDVHEITSNRNCDVTQTDLVKKMLPMVADVNLQNKNGDSALTLVLWNRIFELAHALIDDGADVNLKDASGTTAFLYACRYNHIELFNKILPMVKDINLQNKYSETALHLAIQKYESAIAHSLMDRGAEVNSVDFSGTTAFLYACEYGKLDLVKRMLPLVTDINLQNMDGESALHLALEDENSDIAHALVEGGADVNLTNPLGVSAFSYACKFAEVELIKKMISVAAEINLQNSKGETALHSTIRNQNFEVALVLIDDGADVNLPDASGMTAFLYACKYGKTKRPLIMGSRACAPKKIDLLKKMLPMVADINFQNQHEDSALHLVLYNRDANIAHVLIDEGADVNLTNASGTTASLYAFQFGDAALIKKILPMVIDINLQNDEGKTLLHLALQNQNFDVVHALIDGGAEINITDASGATEFHYACAYGNIDLVGRILPLVPDINLQTIYGESALSLALQAQNFEVAHVLADKDADVNLPDALGTTSFFCACKFAPIDLVEKMVPVVTDLNSPNKDGTSALHLSIKHGRYDVAHVLIAHGADVNLPDSSGTTPLLYACASGSVDLVNKILPTVADINIQNKFHESALHLAVHHQTKLEIVQSLIKSGININLQDKLGSTALHLTCTKRKTFSKAIVLFLLQEPGIELNVKNLMGESPLDLARANPEVDLKILQILENNFCIKNK